MPVMAWQAVGGAVQAAGSFPFRGGKSTSSVTETEGLHHGCRSTHGRKKQLGGP